MDEQLVAYLLSRDGGCVARLVNSRLWASRFPMLQGLPDPGPCRNAAGEPRDATDVRNLTFDEVKMDAPGEPGSHLRMGKKAGHSEMDVVVCWGHHVFGRQWSTSKLVRGALREYLPVANAR
jgi:hypothetical protein